MHVLVRDLHVIRVRQDERRIESRHATPRQHHSGSFACRSMCQNTHIPRACFVPDTGARTNAKRSCRSQPCWRSCPTGSRANVPVPMSDRVVVAPRSWLGWSHRGGTWVRPHLGRMLRAALCTAYSPTVAETRVDATSTTGMRLGMELLDPIDLEAKFQVQGRPPPCTPHGPPASRRGTVPFIFSSHLACSLTASNQLQRRAEVFCRRGERLTFL